MTAWISFTIIVSLDLCTPVYFVCIHQVLLDITADEDMFIVRTATKYKYWKKMVLQRQPRMVPGEGAVLPPHTSPQRRHTQPRRAPAAVDTHEQEAVRRAEYQLHFHNTMNKFEN